MEIHKQGYFLYSSINLYKLFTKTIAAMDSLQLGGDIIRGDN